MAMTIRGLVFAAIVFTFFGTELSATTYRAASCNESDVQAAYTLEQASPADGDIISIPAGTCTWTSTWTMTPHSCCGLTFQGAGAISATTGGAGTTGTDQTIINTNVDPFWNFTTTAANKTYRVTGFAFYHRVGYPTGISDGALYVAGPSSSVRIDHNHFYVETSGYKCINIVGNVFGVADHNFIESRQGIMIWIGVENGRTWNGVSDVGNTSWADVSYWGSNKFFFGEDNRYVNSTNHAAFTNDCSAGGRQVFRYNTIIGKPTIQTHQALRDDQGCRATEAYHNNFYIYNGWQANTLYYGGSDGEVIADPSNHIQQVTSANCTSGSSTPSWNDSRGTTSDGTCTWTDQGAYYTLAPVSSRSGTQYVWGNTDQLTTGAETLTLDRASGINGLYSNYSLSLCGNGDLPSNGGSGFVGTVTVSNGSPNVTLASGNNAYKANIQWNDPNGAQPNLVIWPTVSAPFIYINGVKLVVNSVTDVTHLTLTTNWAGSNGTYTYYVPSVWDGNIDVSGGPCYNMAGRGKGDLMTGTLLPETVTGATCTSGTATVSVSGTNTFTSGYVNVAGVLPAGYNGTFAITGSTSSSVSYSVPCPGSYVSGGGVTSRRNTATNTATWPRNALDPVYAWGNNVSWAGYPNNVVDAQGNMWASNRDYFIDGFTPTTQTSPTSPFNGTNTSQKVTSWQLLGGTSNYLRVTVKTTAGFSDGQTVNTIDLPLGGGRPVNGTWTISSHTSTTLDLNYATGNWTDSGGARGYVSAIGIGQGTLANRPTTCTGGTDPANGGAAAPGVAYWATDAVNTQDAAHPGVLYVCNPTNTWTSHYTPYTYPHPLTQGVPNRPNPPSHLSATVQ